MRRLNNQLPLLTFPFIFSLKWKPPSENTIDFKLRLKFPPDLTADPNGRLPDLTVKPIFLLDQYMGGNDRYEYFDWLWMDDEEWEQ